MKKYLLAAAVTIIISCTGSKSRQDRVLHKYFEECFDQTIGLTSGAFCRFDEDKKEWRITFWGNGSGDCPAGCIYKDFFESYVVDKKGKVFESTQNYERKKQVRPEQIRKWGRPLHSPLDQDPTAHP